MLPLRPETITADQINIHLSLVFQWHFIGDYVDSYNASHHHVTTDSLLMRDEKYHIVGIECSVSSEIS